ncbi:MAG: cobalamin-binding protein [Crocinitomicaceae bacterium]|nr:cobalamin-binding protein [Crocinitomicaceae bacterium]
MALADVPTPHNRETYRTCHAAKVADYLRAMRVVSLVPSWTEFLHDLQAEVVGQTKFCVRPDTAYRSLPRVGGTKTVYVDRVVELQPDLVVANKEENAREDLERLAALLPPSCDILVTDVRTVDAAFDAMSDLGARLERVAQAESWVARIRDAWGDPKPVVGSAAYAVWAKPWMAAGPDTFIHDVMRHWGIHNAVADLPSKKLAQAGRYPNLGDDEAAGVQHAGRWLLPSEPFPFAAKHLEALENAQPGRQFMLVDGEAFSWYGTRMWHAAAHFEEVRRWMTAS